jgi:hypothetical protein
MPTMISMIMLNLLFEEWMMSDITQADAVDDVRPVLPYISTSTPTWMIDRVIIKLIDFTATGDDYITLFEF